MKAVEYLRGKRTYFCAGVGVLLLLGEWLGFYEVDERLLGALGFGGLAFLRSALRVAVKGSDAEGTETGAPRAQRNFKREE